MSERPIYPFTAIVGQEKAKLALLCNAVNPAIGGVLLSGDKGTGKSTMVRALADVLPEIEVVKGCPFNCNPNNELEMCEACREKAKKGEIEIERRKMRVVDLPLSVTVDRLVGTIDIEKALKEGIKALQPGILAEANRNILYIDEVNLLDDYIADILLDAAAMGWNVIEREGISLSHPSRFILVGSMNPEEGELRPQILDRFGLFVKIEVSNSVEDRVEIVKKVEEFQADPMGFRKKFEKKQKELREKIIRAREIVTKVIIDDDLLRTLAKILIENNVRTHRAEIVTVRTAKAIAALDGRKKVSLEDLNRAMELTLPHRMKLKPFEQQTLPKLPSEERKNEYANSGKGQNEDCLSTEKSFDPVDVDIDFDPISKNSHGLKTFRGSRRERATVIGFPHGYPVSYVPFNGSSDIDLVATIKASILNGKNIGENLMVRVRKVRVPRLTVIMLDSSGSMAAKKRIRIAKGVAKRVIENSYVRRDSVALIVFRGDEAQVLVPPTRKYSAILDALINVKTGGKTPLPSALQKLLILSRSFRMKNKNAIVNCVLISDGKANVPIFRSVKDEIVTLAEAIKRSKVRFEIYDTRDPFDPTPSYISTLSEILQARVIKDFY